MAKKTKAQMKAMGTSIMAEAKRIRKASPSKKWQTCVSEAGKHYRNKEPQPTNHQNRKGEVFTSPLFL
jgi:hypothetical protein